MRELAKMEMPDLEEKKDKLEKELTKLLIPKDPQDDKNAILGKSGQVQVVTKPVYLQEIY